MGLRELQLGFASFIFGCQLVFLYQHFQPCQKSSKVRVHLRPIQLRPERRNLSITIQNNSFGSVDHQKRCTYRCTCTFYNRNRLDNVQKSNSRNRIWLSSWTDRLQRGCMSLLPWPWVQHRILFPMISSFDPLFLAFVELHFPINCTTFPYRK